MKNVFINFSNHNSKDWSNEQLQAAMVYGEIVDVPFPMVDPAVGSDAILELGESCFRKIAAYHPAAVMCQGEFTLVYNVIRRLQEAGFTVVAACSDRCVTEENGVKSSIFQFVQFREYC